MFAGGLKTQQKETSNKSEAWRRACGCMRTSDKLKHILKTFPDPPPPTPAVKSLTTTVSDINEQNKSQTEPINKSYTTQYVTQRVVPFTAHGDEFKTIGKQEEKEYKKIYANNSSRSFPSQALEAVEKMYETRTCSIVHINLDHHSSWHIVGELVSLLQLTVMATALALYYIIYCYMQLVYYMLRSAVYFHHADGSMKVTIAVVTITTLFVGFHLLLRMERFFGFS